MFRKIMTIAVLVAFALLLLPMNRGPIIPPGPTRSGTDTAGIYSEKTLSPEREQMLNERQVLSDVQATDELCRNQCSLDLHEAMKALQGAGTAAGRSPTAVLQALQHEHPHMVHLLYRDASGQQTVVGKKPDGFTAVDAELTKAQRIAGEGKVYQSDPLRFGQDTYFVISIPRATLPSVRSAAPAGVAASLTGLVHQRILGAVHDHQMKNLRVVPYPADGHWKIESVDSKTLKDVTVNHPEDNEGTSHYHKNQVVVKFKTPPTDESKSRTS